MIEPLAPAGGKRPVITIIAMNLVPLIGVLFFHWNMKLVVFLYIVETLITIFFNAIKLLMCISNSDGKLKWWQKGIGFFSVLKHSWEVALFTFFVMLFYLLVILRPAIFSAATYDSDAFYQFKLALGNVFIILFADLILFIIRRENRYDADKVFSLMKLPFKRVAMQHLIIVAGTILGLFSSSVALAVVYVGVKLYHDLWMHKGKKTIFDQMAEDELSPEEF